MKRIKVDIKIVVRTPKRGSDGIKTQVPKSESQEKWGLKPFGLDGRFFASIIRMSTVQ